MDDVEEKEKKKKMEMKMKIEMEMKMKIKNEKEKKLLHSLQGVSNAKNRLQEQLNVAERALDTCKKRHGSSILRLQEARDEAVATSKRREKDLRRAKRNLEASNAREEASNAAARRAEEGWEREKQSSKEAVELIEKKMQQAFMLRKTSKMEQDRGMMVEKARLDSELTVKRNELLVWRKRTEAAENHVLGMEEKEGRREKHYIVQQRNRERIYESEKRRTRREYASALVEHEEIWKSQWNSEKSRLMSSLTSQEKCCFVLTNGLQACLHLVSEMRGDSDGDRGNGSETESER